MDDIVVVAAASFLEILRVRDVIDVAQRVEISIANRNLLAVPKFVQTPRWVRGEVNTPRSLADDSGEYVRNGGIENVHGLVDLLTSHTQRRADDRLDARAAASE